ncbi:MAG: NnrS family protein [Myxococcales bacterium]|nr:NnrS family protein [Myxococcales bacterium]
MRPAILLAAGFRPLFLLAALWAIAPTLLWLGAYAGGLDLPVAPDALRWHAHEMLYGFALAGVGGFLLTAVPNWTKTPPPRGAALGALCAAWILGRGAMLASAALPAALVAGLDLLFIPGLAMLLSPPIMRSRNRRNYIFPVLLGVLFATNSLGHLDTMGIVQGAHRLGLHLGIGVVLLMIVIVGGRIVPAFTRNALRKAGASAEPRSRKSTGKLDVIVCGAALLAEALSLDPWIVTISAASAMAILGWQLLGWQSRRTLHDPLLWSLHAGYLALVLGFAAQSVAAAQAIGAPLAASAILLPSTALHVFTSGAIGIMLLSVMSRAALGHTGRPLRASRSMALAYLLVIAGASLRVLIPWLAPAQGLLGVIAGGAFWSLGFAIYLWAYLPILLTPRADGRPG